ncbi:MAG: hypothetical protein AB7L92_08565 [Alphaproteobacteria bacterium]
MTVWLQHIPLSEQQENDITRHDTLPLPLGRLPDLGLIDRPAGLRHLLAALHPDAPPEKLNRLQERTWRLAKGIEEDDIIAVALRHRQVLALAEVVTPYAYRVGDNHEDVHHMHVKWQKKTVPFRRFGRNASIFHGDGPFLEEVTDQKMRETIRAALPYAYNRFAALKWILGIFILWRLFVFATQQGGF